MKKRVIYFIICYLFLLSVLYIKLYALSLPGSIYAEAASSTRSVMLASSRGQIYDRNMNRLTYTVPEYKTCIRPTPAAIIKINGIITDEAALEKIHTGSFTVITTDDPLPLENSEDILNLSFFKRYDGNTLCHITGYLSGSGKGECGIEKEYDDFLNKTNGCVEAVFHTDALGRMLMNEPVEIRDTAYMSKSGVVLTIDREIQKITEQELINAGFRTGAAVVLSAQTSEILACVSLPFYDRNDPSKSADDPDAPFINRAFCAYSVGSVYKVITAAAAIENGTDIGDYTCTGNVIKSGTVFNCSKTDGHGKTDMKKAVAISCNPYFIELSVKTGAKKMVETARKLGFGKSITLYGTQTSQSGYLPPPDELNSDAALANLGFGQGSLLATPLQIAAAYCAIANGGYYTQPTLVKGFNDNNGNFSNKSIPEPKRLRVLNSETSDILKEYLLECVMNGTGKNARSTLFKSGGKTATAQTGRYGENGKEILISWFAGFFPYEKPEYIICIMKENGASGSSDDAPVFKKISERIYKETVNQPHS